jgi:hypothetical protein
VIALTLVLELGYRPARVGLPDGLATALFIGGLLALVAMGLLRPIKTRGAALDPTSATLGAAYPGLRPALLWLLVAAGVALRIATHVQHIETMGGDMLPLVDRAAGALLRGEAPYRTYHFPWPLPLTYWPGTLLAFLPARSLRVHPHWTNLAAELALLVLVARTVGGRFRARRRTAPHPWAHPGLLIACTVFLLPSSIEWFRITTAPVGWLAIGLAIVAAHAGHRLAGAALGLALATTPLAAVLAPFVLVSLLRARGLRAAGGHLAAAAGVLALFVLPFLLWSPGGFIEGAWAWFNDLDRFPRLKWAEARTWAKVPGFSGLLWTLGHESWLKPLQVASVALILALFFRRGAHAAELPRHVAAAYLLFVLWNPILWPYLYQPALVAALLGLAAARSAPRIDAGTLPVAGAADPR